MCIRDSPSLTEGTKMAAGYGKTSLNSEFFSLLERIKLSLMRSNGFPRSVQRCFHIARVNPERINPRYAGHHCINLPRRQLKTSLRLMNKFALFLLHSKRCIKLWKYIFPNQSLQKVQLCEVKIFWKLPSLGALQDG